jgi:hypothetical protein
MHQTLLEKLFALQLISLGDQYALRGREKSLPFQIIQKNIFNNREILKELVYKIEEHIPKDILCVSGNITEAALVYNIAKLGKVQREMVLVGSEERDRGATLKITANQKNQIFVSSVLVDNSKSIKAIHRSGGNCRKIVTIIDPGFFQLNEGIPEIGLFSVNEVYQHAFEKNLPVLDLEDWLRFYHHQLREGCRLDNVA